MTLMTTAETLNAAADLIAEKGWCQGTAQNDQGQHCAGGAIEALYRTGATGSAYVFFEKHLMAKFDGVEFIPMWNDEPGRTKDEVIAELRAAAKAAAEETNQ